MKRNIILTFALMVAAVVSAKSNTQTLVSPDGTIAVNVVVNDKITYSVSVDGNEILTGCEIAMTTDNRTIGSATKLKGVKRGSIDEELQREVPIKNAVVKNKCNTMTLSLSGNCALEFRAFDNGVAYRIITSGKGTEDIIDETVTIGFAADYKAHVSFTGGFKTNYEHPYSHTTTAELTSEGNMMYLPLLFETDKNYKILISEADLDDYPCLFFKGTGENAITSVFPKAPLTFGPDGDRSLKIEEEADYIARTESARTFPWRYFVISKEDKDLVANEMTYVLSSPCEIDDTSWIKPGQVSWDWWNHKMIWGVDFKAGINTATYKYYIDFASQYGIPYIILDEGWSKTTREPFATIPEIDLPELISYGKSKNVGLVLWLTWLTVENNIDELFQRYSEWGVAGVKVDFMDRSDQWMVNFYERVMKEAAKHHLLVDFHGAFKPAGLERRYPNLLSYEGVRGLENNEHCEPDNTIYLPFIRNAVGPMDFTPGAMNSAQPEYNRSTDPSPMGSGTRAYQMAMYVVFESGIQMLSDSPTRYYAEKPCTEFISSVPVTWDETVVLDAKVGDYVVVARRKDTDWFIGAMTGSNSQTLDIKLDFLPDDAKRSLTYFADGANSDRQAMDYVNRTMEIDKNSVLTLNITRNGGWCGRIQSLK